MTQWIFDSSKCTCSAVTDEVQEVQTCALCGLALRTRKGSITQWIFRAQTCTCFDKGESPAVIDVSTVPPNESIPGAPYEFIGVIGLGGLGTVYKARNKKLDRFVAIKTLNSGLDDTRASQNFMREAKSASKLQHPNVVAVQDFGCMQDGSQYLVTEWIDGITLEQYLSRQKTLSLSVAHEIFSQVLDGLSHAHRRGVVHRDIKPGNIMLARAEFGGWIVKIIDFGTAKEIATDGSTTRIEDMAVSPFYISPEQSVCDPVDQRADLYSLGCTLFEALAGRPPFRGVPLSVVMRHQTEMPPTLENASGGVEFPEYIENIVAKLLAKEPVDRFKNADEVKAALLQKQSDKQKISRRSPSLKMAIFALLAILIIAAAATVVTTLSTPKQTVAAVHPRPSPHDTTLDTVLGEKDQRVIWEEENGTKHGLPLTSSLKDIPKARVCKLRILGDYGLEGLHTFDKLEEILFEGVRLTAEDLNEVAMLPSIHKISVNDSFVPRNILELLLPLTGRLTEMQLTGLDLHEKELSLLQRFHNVDRLSLTANDLSKPEAMALMLRMPQLKWLCLNSCGVNDEGIRQLCGHPNLSDLNLSQASVTDEGCKYFRQIPKLLELHISACPQLGDKGLRELAKIPRLKKLDISQSSVSNKGLDYAISMPALEFINVDGCKVTDEGLKKLHAARPTLRTKFADTSHLKDLLDNY